MNEPEYIDPRLLNEDEPPKAKIVAHERGISLWLAWLFWFIVLGISAVLTLTDIVHLDFLYDVFGVPQAFIVSFLVAVIGGLILALATTSRKFQRKRKE